MRESGHRHSQEFREQARKLVRTDGLSVSQAARRMDITVQTLYRWLKESPDDGRSQQSASPTEQSQQVLPNRIVSLERELHLLRDDVAIIMNAIGSRVVVVRDRGWV